MDIKKCRVCGAAIKKPSRYSHLQFSKVLYCGRSCMGVAKSHNHEEQKESFYKRTKPAKNGCIEWIGGRCEKGYGMYSIKGKTVRAHRGAWYFKYNEMPPSNLFVCHHCDNPSCVNTDHLFLGTAKDNNDDKLKKGRAKYFWGEESPVSVLSEKNVIDILKSLVPATKLSKEYGVSQSTIRAIRQGKTWKHIPRENLDS